MFYQKLKQKARKNELAGFLVSETLGGATARLQRAITPH
jgi:hypothetical protein